MRQKRLSPQEAHQRARILWEQGRAIPLPHFKRPAKERNVAMPDTRHLLDSGRMRKDADFDEEHGRWEYVIEGNDLDGFPLAPVFAFDEVLGDIFLIAVKDTQSPEKGGQA